MADRLIEEQAEFEELCGHIRAAGVVAFDSEFVSEYTYRPELGLLQYATRERVVAVDPCRVTDLQPWWDIMADDETTVVVHGGQAEIRFSLTHGGLAPHRLVDVQLAEGLHSRSYPLGYATLVQRVLGKRVHGKETRTDWRRRPLSDQQIAYALEDVQHVLPIWERQRQSLQKLGRLSWAETEFRRMVDQIAAETTRESWCRLPGIHKLGRRELAVATELCRWREQEATRRNRPMRRILRDDLVVELARRQPKSEKDLLATRDLNRSDYKRIAADLVGCVERALAIPPDELPEPPPQAGSEKGQDEHVLGQLLGLALANRCAELNVAKPLVGTSADLRELVRWHLAGRREEPPRLAVGWRAEVCGDQLTDLLDGRVALRVSDPMSDHPLAFERLPSK